MSLSLLPSLAAQGGCGALKIGIIDSGVHAAHPHVGGVAGGIWITETGIDNSYLDGLGHGTAVTAVIREKAPAAAIYAVKVFDRKLATGGAVLLRALDWCLAERMDFVNLSLGTVNPGYVEEFAVRLARARELGTTIVAAYEMQGQRAFPGSLDGVAGVVLDNRYARDEVMPEWRAGQQVYAACGYPRSIPGVAPERNLQGISFAVANVTGWLAAARAASRTVHAGRY